MAGAPAASIRQARPTPRTEPRRGGRLVAPAGRPGSGRTSHSSVAPRRGEQRGSPRGALPRRPRNRGRLQIPRTTRSLGSIAGLVFRQAGRDDRDGRRPVQVRLVHRRGWRRCLLAGLAVPGGDSRRLLDERLLPGRPLPPPPGRHPHPGSPPVPRAAGGRARRGPPPPRSPVTRAAAAGPAPPRLPRPRPDSSSGPLPRRLLSKPAPAAERPEAAAARHRRGCPSDTLDGLIDHGLLGGYRGPGRRPAAKESHSSTSTSAPFSPAAATTTSAGTQSSATSAHPGPAGSTSAASASAAGSAIRTTGGSASGSSGAQDGGRWSIPASTNSGSGGAPAVNSASASSGDDGGGKRSGSDPGTAGATSSGSCPWAQSSRAWGTLSPLAAGTTEGRAFGAEPQDFSPVVRLRGRDLPAADASSTSAAAALDRGLAGPGLQLRAGSSAGSSGDSGGFLLGGRFFVGGPARGPGVARMGTEPVVLSPAAHAPPRRPPRGYTSSSSASLCSSSSSTRATW